MSDDEPRQPPRPPRFRPTPDDPDARPVRHVGDSLSALTRRLGLADPQRIGTVMASWDDVVGAAIAPHTTPRSLREGVLTVEVDGPEWTTNLRYLESDIVRRLSELAGPGVVTSLRFTVVRKG